jgi:hypothetical protein
MDSVRIGKALGIGTRVISKAVFKSLEQTANQKVEQIKTVSGHVERIHAAVTAAPAAAATTQIPRQAAPTRQATTRSEKKLRFGEAIWGPIAHTGGVVWLEVMGLLFGLPALFFTQGLWVHRAAFALSYKDPLFQKELLNLGGTVLFLYFCVSSFVRAERKSRRKR